MTNWTSSQVLFTLSPLNHSAKHVEIGRMNANRWFGGCLIAGLCFMIVGVCTAVVGQGSTGNTTKPTSPPVLETTPTPTPETTPTPFPTLNSVVAPDGA